MQEHAAHVMKASPIGYVREAELRGSIFGNDCNDGTVSSTFTDFFVDHAEPFEALARTREESGWLLGELPEGHEFFLVAEVIRRRGQPLISA